MNTFQGNRVEQHARARKAPTAIVVAFCPGTAEANTVRATSCAAFTVSFNRDAAMREDCETCCCFASSRCPKNVTLSAITMYLYSSVQRGLVCHLPDRVQDAADRRSIAVRHVLQHVATKRDSGRFAVRWKLARCGACKVRQCRCLLCDSRRRRIRGIPRCDLPTQTHQRI